MRRDLDLIRRILLGQRDGKAENPIEGFDDESVRYHRALLIHTGLAEGRVAKDFTRPTDIPAAVAITDLSWRGHALADAIANEANWERAKRLVAETESEPTIEALERVIRQEPALPGGQLVWSGDDFKRYFQSLIQEFAEKNGLDAHLRLEKDKAALSRNPGSGPQLAAMVTEYAGKGLYEPAMQMLELFEKSCAALHVTPIEEDYVELRRQIDAQTQVSLPHVKREVEDDYRRYASMGAPDIAERVAANADREVARRIERRILELRHAPERRLPSAGEELLGAFDDVNRAARSRFGFSLFYTSSYRATQDVLRDPATRDEFAGNVQAMALLIDQINEEVEAALRTTSDTGKVLPDGSINRLEQLFRGRGVPAEDNIFRKLRDIRRIGNDYPRHPGNADVEAAAMRLQVNLPPTSSRDTWSLLAGQAADSLRALSRSLRKT
jgi:hypothetical protein